jgi:hypothetical protein
MNYYSYLEIEKMNPEVMVVVGAILGIPVLNTLINKMLSNDEKYVQKEICLHLLHIAEALTELRHDHKRDTERIIDRLAGRVVHRD